MFADIPWSGCPWWLWPEAQTAIATWVLALATIVLLGGTLLAARAAVAAVRLEREPAIIAEEPTAELEREKRTGIPLQRYYFEITETGKLRPPYRMGETTEKRLRHGPQELNSNIRTNLEPFIEIALRNVGRSAAVDLHIQFNVAFGDSDVPIEILFEAQVNAVPVGLVMLVIANRCGLPLQVFVDPHTAYDIPARRKRRWPRRGLKQTKRPVEVYSAVMFFCPGAPPHIVRSGRRP